MATTVLQMNPLDCTIEYLLGLPAPAVLTTHVLPWCEQHGLITSREFASNLHTALYVALFYQVCFVVGKYLIFPPLVRWRKPHDAVKLVDQSSVHFVSFVQSVVVLRLSIEFLLSEYYHPRFTDPWTRIFGTDGQTTAIVTFAMGYFLWDIYISSVYSTLPFVLHAVVSTVVFCIGMKPYIQYYGGVFLMFELSNPFLNIRWFCIKYSTRTNVLAQWFETANNLLLMLVFFLARIVWGWYQIANLAYDFWLVRHDPRFLPLDSIVIVVGNFVLDVLNVVWFSTMVSVAIKTVRGTH